MQSCSCLGGAGGVLPCPGGVTVPLGRGWELLECSQTHTVHQEPQPTDLCFLCNNQIKVLTETPWLCCLVLGRRQGRKVGTRGWDLSPRAGVGGMGLSREVTLHSRQRGPRASPAMISKGFQCFQFFPFLLFLKCGCQGTRRAWFNPRAVAQPDTAALHRGLGGAGERLSALLEENHIPERLG